MASDIRISELNEINVNSNVNEIIINSRESSNDTGISKKIQVANFLTDSIVKTNNLDNLSVTTDKLAGQAITANKIADKTITNSQIADRTITNSVLDDNSVDNRVLDNADSDYTVRGITATSSVASPAVQVSNRLSVSTGQVTINSIPYNFPSTEVPRNFLRTDGSGNLTWAEAVPGDGTALVFSDTSPVGTIIPWAGGQSSIPDDKWINLFSERRFLGSTYPELRDLLGTQWGPRTTPSRCRTSPTGAYYALPDLRARAVVGAGQGSDGTDVCNAAFATYGGKYKHTLTYPQMPAHRHVGSFSENNSIFSGRWGYIATSPGQGSNGGIDFDNDRYGFTTYAGGASVENGTTTGVTPTSPHNNTQPYVAMSYIIKAKPDDIQQYNVNVGPGLSALDAQSLQTEFVNLSSTQIGLKVTDDFQFDGSGRLKLTGTQVYATVDHIPDVNTYLRNCTLTRTAIGRYTITINDIGTRPTAVASLANNWTLQSPSNSFLSGQYAISVSIDNSNTSIYVECVSLESSKKSAGSDDANTVSYISRSYVDVPFQVIIAN